MTTITTTLNAAIIEKLGSGYDEIIRKKVSEALKAKCGADKIGNIEIGSGEDAVYVTVEFDEGLEGTVVTDTVTDAISELSRA